MWPDRVWQALHEGEEPDPRFTLANERTFLAWIRTALALIAGGIGLEAFTVDLLTVEVRRAVAVGLVVLGTLTSLTGLRRWLGSQRALRTGRPLPLPTAVPLLAYGVAVVSLALLAAVLAGRR